jgi:peptide-methionine (S)-S-oxide reductase
MFTTPHHKIGFGGGCHWCTEAVFQSLKGIQQVEQGWIASQPPHNSFSEAVIVTYSPAVITLADLISVHLHTHASTSNHSMRHKYRSAVYWFVGEEAPTIKEIIADLQSHFNEPVITQVLPFVEFKLSLPEHLNYYHSNPEKPFCTVYIHPKLDLLKTKFTHLQRGEIDKL